MRRLLKKATSYNLNKALLTVMLLTVLSLVLMYLYNRPVFSAYFTPTILIVGIGLLLFQNRKYKIELIDHLTKELQGINTERLIKKNKHEVADVINKHSKLLYSQVESINHLYMTIKPVKPLPTMTGGAATPELAYLIASIIRDNKRKNIVDIGSGTTSLVAGYSIKNLEDAKVTALDHEHQFYTRTKQLVEEHRLSDCVDVVHAPLKSVKLKNKEYKWYNPEKLTNFNMIDLVIVDGPPGGAQNKSRFPALPILWDSLSPDAIIIVDDFFRDDENNIVKEWLQEYPELELETIENSKGIAVLKRSPS